MTLDRIRGGKMYCVLETVCLRLGLDYAVCTMCMIRVIDQQAYEIEAFIGNQTESTFGISIHV